VPLSRAPRLETPQDKRYIGVLIPGITVFDWGSDAQRAFIRERVMTGRQRLAVAVSELDSGSDAAALRTAAQVFAGHGSSTESVMSFRYRESIVAMVSGGTSQIQRTGIARSGPAELLREPLAAAGSPPSAEVLVIPNEPGSPARCRLEPSPQEREHAVQEELPLVCIEVELVLVTQQRLVGGGGKEECLWLDPLRAEPLGDHLRDRPERIAVSHRDKCRGKCGRNVVGH